MVATPLPNKKNSTARTVSSRLAVVLVNLGTPDTADSRGVRAFLRRFLSDRRVVTLPRLLWLPILYLFVLTLRPSRTAKLYQKIWDNGCSPLARITADIANALGPRLHARHLSCDVRYAMCYSAPGIAEVMDDVMDKGAHRVLILPLYPQYSSTTTATVFEQYALWCKRTQVLPEVAFVRDYHDHPAYIEALAAQIRAHWQTSGRAERLLLSFHGLPEQGVLRGDIYVEQCRTSARLLTEVLGLKAPEWRLAFQSRFGWARWVSPYTDEVLAEWAREGLGSVDVFCPGFAADCLETLEEMAITNRALFEHNGGGDYRFIPCLNADEKHIAALSELVYARMR